MNSATWIQMACFRALALVAVALFAVACTYTETDNPLVRKLSWFSYLNGDDVRAACRVGGPEHWRFVYNGIYTEQFRTYDLAEQKDGTFRLRVNVVNKPDLSELTVRKLGDLVDPWRGKIDTVLLGRDQRDLLARASGKDGVFDGAPKGLQLSSDSFYWTGVVCRNGQVSFSAHQWPSPSFKALSFPAILLAWDPTGRPLNPPRETSDLELHGAVSPDHKFEFNIGIGDNGLVGVKPWF